MIMSFQQLRIVFFYAENDSIENKGEVKLEMMENIGLQSVQVRFIPAVMAYDLYLTERKMDFNLLNL